MKIIGKSASGFLCDLTPEEINYITIGQSSRPSGYSDVSIGHEIPICEMFKSVRDIEDFKTGKDYLSVRTQLSALLKALEPIEFFTNESKTRLATRKTK